MPPSSAVTAWAWAYSQSDFAWSKVSACTLVGVGVSWAQTLKRCWRRDERSASSLWLAVSTCSTPLIRARGIIARVCVLSVWYCVRLVENPETALFPHVLIGPDVAAAVMTAATKKITSRSGSSVLMKSRWSAASRSASSSSLCCVTDFAVMKQSRSIATHTCRRSTCPQSPLLTSRPRLPPSTSV